MSYITLCVEFSNPGLAIGHIKDARAAYTTNSVAPPVGINFVLYPLRWKNETDARGNVPVQVNKLIEDSISPLSLDQGINYFSTFENPQTFSFSLIDDDRTYYFATRNQALSGKVLIKYRASFNGAEVEYDIGLLDIYSIVVENGIAKFDCDSVASWSDQKSDTTLTFFGDIVDEKLPISYKEEKLLYQAPLPIVSIEDGRLPLFNGGVQTKLFFDTPYTVGAPGYTKIHTSLVYNASDASQELLRKYIGSPVLFTVIDGKGVGTECFGTLKLTEFFSYYYLEVNHRKATPPKIISVNDTEYVVDLDRSSYIEIGIASNVFDLGGLVPSNIKSVKIEVDGHKLTVPKDYLAFQGNNMILKATQDKYHIALPIILEDFSTYNASTSIGYLTDGDFDIGKPALTYGEANAILADNNVDNFIATQMNNGYGVGSGIRFVFRIDDSGGDYVYSKFNNASKYVLNGKIQAANVGAPSQNRNISMGYEMVTGADGAYQSVAYDAGNYPITSNIISFTDSVENWFTLNRYVVNNEYVGVISAGENFYTNQVDLELGERSEDLKKIRLSFNVNSAATTSIRLYNLNIDAEFSVDTRSIDAVYITLNDNHPGASLNTVDKIIDDLYTSNVPGTTYLVKMPSAPAKLVLDTKENTSRCCTANRKSKRWLKTG
jgi:hypothetical protein